MNCAYGGSVCHLKYNKEFNYKEMIERVAKAIYCTEFPTLNSGPWDEYQEKENYYHVAKIAILAMVNMPND